MTAIFLCGAFSRPFQLKFDITVWELRSLATPDFETDKIYKPKIRCEDDNGNEEHEVWVRTVPGESVSDCTRKCNL